MLTSSDLTQVCPVGSGEKHGGNTTDRLAGGTGKSVCLNDQQTPSFHGGKPQQFRSRSSQGNPFTPVGMGRQPQTLQPRDTQPSVKPPRPLRAVNSEFTRLTPKSTPLVGQSTLGTLESSETGATAEGDRLLNAYGLPNLRVGEQVHVRLNSNEFDPYLQLVDQSTGQILATNDDGTDHNSRLTFKVKSGVEYQLHITSYSGSATGQYELKTERFLPRQRQHFDFDYGHGLVDAPAAIAEVMGTKLSSNNPPPRSSLWASKVWGRNTLETASVWQQGMTGQDITVAVIDTGVQTDHQDLKGNLWRNPQEIPGNGKDDDGNGFVDDSRGWNFADNNGDVADRWDHGTHIAGIIAANRQGKMQGVAPDAQIMPIRVVGEAGGGQAEVAQGIRYAVKNGADVINLSLGADPGSIMDNRLKRALRFADKKGVAIVVAAGNERQTVGATQPGEPAGYTADESLGLVVGAVDSSYAVAPFSNPTGNRRSPFVVAPGMQIFSLSSQDPSGYKWRQGTSMAAAYVSGLVALMLSANPDLTPRQIRQIISETANDKGVKVA
ncbi:MAG: S8 family peptidase [Leptolyngbyaceae cyanobacterium]